MIPKSNDETVHILPVIEGTSAQDTYVAATPQRARFAIIAVSLVVFLVGGLVTVIPYYQKAFSTDTFIARESIRTSIVRRGIVESDVVVQGRIVTANSPTIYSAEMGTIDLAVNAGDAVESNQLLARVTSPSLNEAFAREKSTRLSMNIDLQRQKIDAKRKQTALKQMEELSFVNLTAMQREIRRAEKAKKFKLVSDIDYQASQDALDKAQLEYRQAQQNYLLEKEALSFEAQTLALQLEHQTLIIAGLKRRIDALNIISPVTGMVGSIQVDDRSVVTANQALMTIVDLTAFEVEAHVSQRHADELSLSMPVEIRLNGLDFSGEIIGISPEVINNEVITRIRFIGEKPSQLRQNQRLTARIILARKEDVLLVGKGPLLDSFQGSVFKVIGDQAIRVPIQMGSTSLRHIEIIEGLNLNDEIIIFSPDIEVNTQTLRLTH